MDSLLIRGGRPLRGEIAAAGAKNAALPLLCAALLTDRPLTLTNVPHLNDISTMLKLLRQMGVKVERQAGAAPDGGDVIRIQGVAKLDGAEFRVMPDRIETGTYLCAAAATGGDVRVTATSGAYLDAVIDKLLDAGCEVTTERDAIRLKAPRRLNAVSIRTAPYPAFPTDMQAQFMAINTVASGAAMIRETIFENRFMHAVEMIRLGADIRIDGNTAVVTGRERLDGAIVMATDLRASAGLVIAGLAARGETRIERIYHLDRGYAALDGKLQSLGADVQRIK